MAWEKLGSASVGGTAIANNSWKEIARTTLGSASDTITVDSIPARDNLMIIPYVYDEGSNQVYGQGRFNNDSGSNYANRWSRNGGSDTTNINQTEMITYFAGAAFGEFGIFEMANIAGQEKLLIDHGVAADATGAGTAPKRHEGVHKWANTSNQVTRFDYLNGGAGTFGTGSEVVVLGYDNDEADSGTNFWQELADVELSSSGDLIDSGTFTAKKYLMIEAVGYRANDSIIPALRVGNETLDTGNNYARRQSVNGGSDVTVTSQSSIATTSGAGYLTKDIYFIVNKSDKEKLVINHGYVTGSGASTAGDRQEIVGKWANTSAQINRIGYLNVGGGSSDFGAGSYIKVYGAD
ncbi:hypothetical protein [Nitrososphaeria virus YSH_174770]|uniref:Uncharacterized protein n=1 Tax=Nitrososphaeria virus YSH_174770 TaxID=3071322 RepID=A0A976YDY4_9CAUD|nr:hypothetical protein QKV93_gp63 [Yangshan Harbor Nitrososphaeria virus]UVF62408.1 hypothetical protein [Nitrososphaeria virus YSH_174770]